MPTKMRSHRSEEAALKSLHRIWEEGQNREPVCYWREFEGLWSRLLGVKKTYASTFQNEILPLSLSKISLALARRSEQIASVPIEPLSGRRYSKGWTCTAIRHARPVRSRPSFYATMTHRRRRNTARHGQNSPGHWVIVGNLKKRAVADEDEELPLCKGSFEQSASNTGKRSKSRTPPNKIDRTLLYRNRVIVPHRALQC